MLIPPAQVRLPPDYRCGLLRFDLPTTFVRALSTMRPCARLSVTEALLPGRSCGTAHTTCNKLLLSVTIGGDDPDERNRSNPYF